MARFQAKPREDGKGPYRWAHVVRSSKGFRLGFVCEGDAIHCEKDGYHVTARIFRDDCPDAPDKRQDGFWPSLYKDAPGFIGPGKNFRQRFDDAQARAEHIMGAWRKDDWFYCGVVLSVSFAEIKLLDCAASLC